MLRYLLLNNRNLRDVNPLECGEEDCQPNYQVGPMAREYYLLHYVYSGKGVMRVQGKTYNVEKGQIFIIHPHDIVLYEADGAEPWHYSWIGFQSHVELPKALSGYVLDLPQAEHLFRAMKDCDQTAMDKEYFLCGKIYELLALLGRSGTPTKSKTAEHMLQAKNYIDTNYIAQITVEQIADQLHINRCYFSTAFKKHIGKSPQQYLMDVRLQKAADLIANYGYTVSAAALSVGYADIFNFSKMFKRKYGLSPTAYAQSKKNLSADKKDR